MTTTQTDRLTALHDAAVAAAIQVALANLGDRDNATRDVLLAALQARDQQGPIKTWRERIEETCPAIGPMHIHASVEEVNDAMQAEIDDLRAAMQELAREGEAVANSAILARGRFHAFKGEDGEPDDWEWFEEGTNCEHGCIDAVIVRADTIAAPQPAQPSEHAQPEQGELEEFREGQWWLVELDAMVANGTPDQKRAVYGVVRNLMRQFNELQSAQPVEQPLTESQHFSNFIAWANKEGYDCACTCNSDTGEWIALNPMTADLWKAWKAAHGIGGGR